MKSRKALTLIGTTALCFWPLMATAQDAGFTLEEGAEEKEPVPIYTSALEVGFGYNNSDSFKFGEYTGLVEEEFFIIGNVDAALRDAYDDDSALYLEFYGRNLGLDSRSIEIEGGAQGQYGGRFFYQEIPHFLSEDALTPYRGEGSNRLTLGPGYPGIVQDVSPRTTDEITANANLRSIDIENKRERLGGSLFWLPFENWRFDVEYRHEEREGTTTTFGMFGENGGNPVSAALAEPIDYETDEVEATAGYAGKRLQLEARYTGSFFRNANEALFWENAYTGGTISGNKYTDIPEQGRMALPPDNQAHNFSISAGYSVTPTTRVTASAGYGLMLQDEDFLDYTVNPGLAVPTALPRDSLDGRINIWRAEAGLSTRPIQALDLSARYRFHDRDNETDQDEFRTVPNDVGTQGGNDVRVNTPHSFTQHLVNLDAGYRILPRTTASVGYEYENMDRTFAERENIREHTAKAKLRSQPVDFFSGWVSYARAWRSGEEYIGNLPFRRSTIDDGTGLPPDEDDFENHPDLRKYNVANRTRDEVAGVATFLPLDSLVLTLRGSYSRDDYRNTELGLKESDAFSTTADLSYSPTEWLTGSVYYTYQQMTFDQRGHSFNFVPGSAFDDTRRWSTETEDRIHTVGAGLTWAGLDNRLELIADYAYSTATTSFDIDANSSLQPTEDLPDIQSDIHSVGLTADFKVMPAVSLKVGYRFEYFRSEDWALDNVDPDTMDRVLWFGGDSPDYTNHVIGTSLVMRF